METLTVWLKMLLEQEVSPALLAVILGLGLIVACIVGIIRGMGWNPKKDWPLWVVVFVVSLLVNLYVFYKFGAMKVEAIILSTLFTAISAIWEHQALKKVLKPAYLSIKAVLTGGSPSAPT